MRRGEISRDEAIVLVTLARYVVRADGQISDAELNTMMRLAKRVGLDVFADAMERTEASPPSTEEIEALAARVSEPRRPLVLDTLVELARSDGLADPERDLLGTLARAWALPAPG